MATVLQNSTRVEQKSKNQTHRNTYNSAEMITLVVGFMMIIIAISGFFYQSFLGLDLSFMHRLVLFGSGGLAIWSGLLGDRQDRLAYRINLGLGLFFLANAVLGYLIGDASLSRTGVNEDLVQRFAPGFLELSVYDHSMHGALAVWFLLDAVIRKKREY